MANLFAWLRSQQLEELVADCSAADDDDDDDDDDAMTMTIIVLTVKLRNQEQLEYSGKCIVL